MMSELKKKRLSVHMIKNFEYSRLFDENDSEDEAKAQVQLGTTREQREEDREVEKRKSYKH